MTEEQDYSIDPSRIKPETLEESEDSAENAQTDELDEIVDQVDEVVEESGEALGKAKPYGYIDNIEDWTKAGKDPKKFKTPQEFNRYAETFERDKALQARLDELSRQNKELLNIQKHNYALNKNYRMLSNKAIPML